MKKFLEYTLEAVKSELNQESDLCNSNFNEIEKSLKDSVCYELQQARIKFCEYALKSENLNEIKECAEFINKIRSVIDQRFEYQSN